MALGPRLDLRQSQSLVMTPQLQQAIKLLAASNLEIEAFVGDALDANPLLEIGEAPESRSNSGEAEQPANNESEGSEAASADQLMMRGAGEGDAPLDLDPGAMGEDRETGDGARGDAAPGSDMSSLAEWGAAGGGAGSGSSGSGEFVDFEAIHAGTLSLGDHLRSQIGALAKDPREAFIAHHIIGLLDDAGYFSFDISAVADDLGASLAETQAALAKVQMLDPSGVGATSLAQCLAIQAREADRFDPCMARLIDNLELLARGEVARLKRLCRVDDEDFADMLRELRSYDPKPGLAFAPTRDESIVPDILLREKGDGGWDIALNEETLPQLIVNRGYAMELEGGASDDATKSWLKEKLADAHWLIRALDQRQKTILKTAAAIVKRQDGFFRGGVAHLRPLTLREIAEEIEMHESTVSRVTSNKYLHCARGCFELKYFFSSGIASADGEGASSESIKARIKKLIDAEDPKKVLSDQKLGELLGEEGFDLARRTVAKYREAIGIGSSAQRRRAKKLAGLSGS